MIPIKLTVLSAFTVALTTVEAWVSDTIPAETAAAVLPLIVLVKVTPPIIKLIWSPFVIPL